MMTAGRFCVQLKIPVTHNFDFWRTVYSHGWCALPPFSSNKSDKSLSRVLSLWSGEPVACKLCSKRKTIEVTIEGGSQLTKMQSDKVTQDLRTCLRLDENFEEFYRVARRYPRYRWISRVRAGRLLRSPTMFEDAVKMICTTNCTWALTTLMVTNLVETLGKKSVAGAKSFPEAQDIAATSVQFLRREIKAGYRAPYLLEMAERVASGDLDIEGWRTSQMTTADLHKEMRNVKGIGPYAAANLLKLSGRYDYLGLDSWVRGKYYELHTKGRLVKDSTIEKRYHEYGSWRGLFFWLEMTRHFHEDKFTF